jgi:hypothetical protein
MKVLLFVIGKPGPLSRDHYASLEERGFVLEIVPVCDDLFKTESCEACEIAVLLPTLSDVDLMETAQLIRRRRPGARILIVRREEWWMDDALYDDRLAPEADPQMLLSAVERLSGSGIHVDDVTISEK